MGGARRGHDDDGVQGASPRVPAGAATASRRRVSRSYVHVPTFSFSKWRSARSSDSKDDRDHWMDTRAVATVEARDSNWRRCDDDHEQASG